MDFALGLATPTPSRGRVSFQLVLPRDAQVMITVHDVAGRQVGEPASQPLAAGEHELFWENSAARPGIYFVCLAIDGMTRARRTIVLVH